MIQIEPVGAYDPYGLDLSFEIAPSDGMNVASGNWDPTQVTFALRLPAKYKVAVSYADGLERTVDADLSEKPRLTLNVDRGEKSNDDEF